MILLGSIDKKLTSMFMMGNTVDTFSHITPVLTKACLTVSFFMILFGSIEKSLRQCSVFCVAVLTSHSGLTLLNLDCAVRVAYAG